MLRRLLLGLASLVVLPVASQAQQAPAYTLRVQSGLVVEDVSVVDRQGKPVTGLAATAFHVTEDGKAQTVRTLQEATGSEQAPTVATPDSGMRTNATLLHGQGTIAALLIDPSTMMLEEQMYLRLQALKFVDSAPAGYSMAVFRVNAAGVPVLLQPLTENKAQLRTAIDAAVPRMTRPTYSTYRNALVELENISAYLRPVPGRKAVFWLAGAFPLYVPPDYGNLCDQGSGSSCASQHTGQHADAEQRAYRALQDARVAVYPIDVRGVQMGGLAPVPIADRGVNEAPTDPGAKPTSESERVSGQYDEMDKLAEATGGRAFYSNNHVAGLLEQALQTARQGYTLTYHPDGNAEDGKWHRIRIQVDGPYTVHYREGYFAANAAVEPKGESQGELRRPLVAGNAGGSGNAPQADGGARPTGADEPLVFQARVVAEGKPGTAREVRVRYVIPTDQLRFDGPADGHARFQLSALGYNTEGDVLSRAMDIVDTKYTAEQKHLADRIGTPTDQTVQVARGARYLLLAVVDLRTERVGVLQLPLDQVASGGAPANPAHRP